MNNTPRTDAVVLRVPDATITAAEGQRGQVRQLQAAIQALYEGLEMVGDHARQLEQELNAALICAGVASKERGEWAVEREAITKANPTLTLIREAIFNELDILNWDFSMDENRVDFADRVVAWISQKQVTQTTPTTKSIAIATRLQEWSINPSMTDALLVKEIREGADTITVLVDALLDIERDADYGSKRDDLFKQIFKKIRAVLRPYGR